MAAATLLDCPSCAARVSVTAPSCPQCGAVLKTPRRGFFGWLFLLAFWGWNILMAVWLVGAAGLMAEQDAALTSEAERAGAAIGAGLGVTVILIVWAVGAVITGLMALFTRPRLR